MINTVTVKRGIGVLMLLIAATSIFVQRAHGETAWAAYQKCKDEAAVEANSCYQNADGYFSNRKCDLIWDINNAACLNKLIGELK